MYRSARQNSSGIVRFTNGCILRIIIVGLKIHFNLPRHNENLHYKTQHINMFWGKVDVCFENNNKYTKYAGKYKVFEG